MIVDTSAFIALLRGEALAPSIAVALHDSDDNRMSAGARLECELVASAWGPSTLGRLHALLVSTRIQVEAFTPEQAVLACHAHSAFGRRSGSPARLNFGDCMSYALARDRDEALLFVGDDFTHTDVRVAPLPS